MDVATVAEAVDMWYAMDSIDQTVTQDISAHVTMLQDVDILDNVLMMDLSLNPILDRNKFFLDIYICSQWK